MTHKFAILIATCNGAPYLKQQLHSLQMQNVSHADVWLSDDRSSDQTLAIASDARDKWTKGSFDIRVRRARAAPKKTVPWHGATANFLSLISNDAITADYYALCDQDDIWDTDKLGAARDWLSAQPADIPCLHCSRTRIIDSAGNQTGMSPLFVKPPSFENAIIQNIAAGNTIVMNDAAMRLVRRYPSNNDFVSHDWWCYQLVTACGGRVCYSAEPKIGYRQHHNNLVGENASWKSRLIRVRQVMSGRFRNWNAMNCRAMETARADMTPSSLATLDAFNAIRGTGGLTGVARLAKSGIHRQTVLGQMALFAACFLRKV